MSNPLRPMRARDTAEAHRASTELELFFDLVIVIAIASLTAAFHYAISAGQGVEKLPNFVFVFLALWWAWMNFTWFASAFDNDDALYRLLVLVIMAGALIFAGGISFIFETLNFSFGIIGWIVMRTGMVSLWLRAARHSPHLRKTCYRYASGIVFAQALWVLLAFFAAPGSMSFYLFGCCAFLVEWSVPVWAERAGRTPWHRHHMLERYGLLTIIVLGEVLLSIAMTFGALFVGTADPVLIKIGLAALIIVFAYWWIYFAETHHLSTSDFGRTFVWGYGHVFIFGSIAVMGAGLAAYFDLQNDHSKASAEAVGWFVGGPLAIAMLTLWAVRDRYLTLGSRSLALPVGAIAILIATTIHAEPFVFAALAVAALLWRVPFSNTEGQHL
jgi:low temperature requirement protein LtrA